jgi:putative ribosome biogenesis GTPase RsgA
VRRMSLKQESLLNRASQLPYPMCGSGMFTPYPLIPSNCTLYVDISSQSGVGKSSVINHVFHIQIAVSGHDQRLSVTD